MRAASTVVLWKRKFDRSCKPSLQDPLAGRSAISPNGIRARFAPLGGVDLEFCRPASSPASRLASSSVRTRHQHPFRRDRAANRRRRWRRGFQAGPGVRSTPSPSAKRKSSSASKFSPRDGVVGLWSAAARIVFAEDFEGRVLPFDETCSARYADILRRTPAALGVRSRRSTLIASVRGSRRAGRHPDIGGFEDCGLALINPWELP